MLTRDAERTTSYLRVLLLGPFEVYRDGVRLETEGWQRSASTLLKLLATAERQRRLRDDLIETLWPEGSRESGASNLRYVLSVLRRSLGGGDPPPILSEHGWVSLSPAYTWEIDLVQLDQVEGTSPDEACRLWRGEPLEEDRYEDWAAPVRAWALKRRREIYLEIARSSRERGKSEDAIALLDQLLETDPTDEDALRMVLLAYADLDRRSEALRRYTQFERVLRDELGVAPSSATSAIVQSLRGTPAAPAAEDLSPAPSPTFPARGKPYLVLPEDATPFIGREDDVARVLDLLQQPEVRLVTLVGTGGTGKTRLAIQAGRAMVDHVAGGVVFVPLAPVVAPHDVPEAVASALGVRPEREGSVLDAVRHAVRGKTMLFILDNYEHVLEAAGVVSTLLEMGQGISVMATSRERLHLTREHVFDVSTLSIPPETARSPAELGRYDAVRLFVERARAAQVGFEPSSVDLEIIASICRRLEGLPLAIELAASRVRHFSLPALLERLSNRLKLLTGGPRDVPSRQQTLWNTIAWSDELLSPDERLLLARLSVFRSGWIPEAARAVCDPEDRLDVESGIEMLLDKSLIYRMQTADNTARYSMLELIAEYAAERLEGADDAESVRRRHAQYFATCMEGLWDVTVVRDAHDVFRTVEREAPNADVALRWAANRDEIELGLRLLSSVAIAWNLMRIRDFEPWHVPLVKQADRASPPVRAMALAHSIVTELDQLYPEILPLGTDRDLLLDGCVSVVESQWPKPLLIHFLTFIALTCGMEGDYERCKRYAEVALRAARDLNAPLGIADSLRSLAEADMGLGRMDVSIAHYEEALAIDRSLGMRTWIAYSLHGLAYRYLLQRDDERTMALAREAIPLYREAGDIQGWQQTQVILACAALAKGEHEVVEEAARAVMAEPRAMGLGWPWPHMVSVLAASVAGRGRLLAAARGFSAAFPHHHDEMDRLFILPALAAAQAAADPVAWDAAWKEGRNLSLDEAAQLLLEGSEP